MASENISTERLQDCHKLLFLEFFRFPVLANYQPGTVTNRLYVKNLRKTTNLEELTRIFSSFVDTHSTDSKYVNSHLYEDCE